MKISDFIHRIILYGVSGGPGRTVVGSVEIFQLMYHEHVKHASSLRSGSPSAGSWAPLYSVKSRVNIKSRWAVGILFVAHKAPDTLPTLQGILGVPFAHHVSRLRGGAMEDGGLRFRYCKFHVLTFGHGLDWPTTWKRRLDFWGNLSITSTANTLDLDPD